MTNITPLTIANLIVFIYLLCLLFLFCTADSFEEIAPRRENRLASGWRLETWWWDPILIEFIHEILYVHTTKCEPLLTNQAGVVNGQCEWPVLSDLQYLIGPSQFYVDKSRSAFIHLERLLVRKESISFHL